MLLCLSAAVATLLLCAALSLMSPQVVGGLPTYAFTALVAFCAFAGGLELAR